MTKPKCQICSKYRPLNEDGWCSECVQQMGLYSARTSAMCRCAPCFTPHACDMAGECKGLDK